MQIRELYLKNFGKFTDRTFLIKDGLNLFYGENEFGKSTLFAFIKGMLFGMERARGRASKNDAFSQYEPWENPNYYAGVLRFESGGRIFRIERSFDKITKSASLICEDDGEELSMEQGDLEALLDGMTRNSFENTIAIGQLGVETNQDLATELKNYAANYYESKDGELDVAHALSILKEKQHEVDQNIRQETLKNERKRSRIEQECEYVRRDIEKLKIDEHYARTFDEEMKDDTYEDELEEEMIPEKSGINKRGLILAVAIFALLLVIEAGFILIFHGASWIILIVIASGVLDVFLLVQFIASVRRIKFKYEEEIELDNQKDLKGQKRSWELRRIHANLREKQVRLNNLNERLEELEHSGYEITKNDKKSQAIHLATETITRLSEEIVKGFGHSLNEKASHIISAITEEKYEKLYIDEKMNMFLVTKDKRVAIERLSRGTIEQVYFALRMAVIEILYEEEFPIILDDTFVFYDDTRLEAVLKWLAAQKRQVILFTCQKRERDILSRLEIPFGINE